MADTEQAEQAKSKGGRPPGRPNNRTLALGAQIGKLLPSSKCLRVLDRALTLALAKGATAEDIRNGVTAAMKGLAWQGSEALVKQPLPEPQRHVVAFEYEDPLERPDKNRPDPAGIVRKRGTRRKAEGKA